MRVNSLIIWSVIFGLASIFPRFAMANDGPITTAGQIIYFICKAGNFIFTALVLLSVVILLYAALLFLTAGGDTEKTKSAKETLTWGVVGLILALLAKGLVIAIGNVLGTGVDIC